MKTEQKNDDTHTASLRPVDDTSIGSFRSVLKNRSFLLLWLPQLLPQFPFNAANYGVFPTVPPPPPPPLLVALPILSFPLPAVPFSLLAGVYVDYLNKR